MIINPASTRSQPWRGRGGARNVNSIRRAFFGGGAGGQGGSNLRRNVPKPVRELSAYNWLHSFEVVLFRILFNSNILLFKQFPLNIFTSSILIYQGKFVM